MDPAPAPINTKPIVQETANPARPAVERAATLTQIPPAPAARTAET